MTFGEDCTITSLRVDCSHPGSSTVDCRAEVLRSSEAVAWWARNGRDDFAMTMPTRNDFIATADFAMIHPEACGSLALLTDPILRAQRAAVPTRHDTSRPIASPEALASVGVSRVQASLAGARGLVACW
jgi:hypothetical protein